MNQALKPVWGLFFILLAVTAVSLALSGGVTAASAQDPPYGPTLSFAVYRNGEPIGRHTLAFQHNGRDLTVSTTIDFAVKVLGITAYRYTHRVMPGRSSSA